MYKHVLLQTNISPKLGSQMINREIPILSHINTFQMRYSGGSISSHGFCGTYLNFMFVRSHYVQICVASNKCMSQTRKVNEKPKNTHFR